MDPLAPTAPSPAVSALSRLAAIARLVAILGLVALAAWQALRRPARDEARAAFARKDYATALRRALDDLDGHPRSAESAGLAARSLSLLVFADEAEPYYQRAARGGPLGLQALRDRAEGLVLSNRRDAAVAACREILDRFGEDPTALRLMSTVRWTQGRFDEAASAAERLSRTAEGQRVGLALLGDIQHEAKHRKEAAAAFEKLLAIDPKLETVKYPIAVFYQGFSEDLVAIGRADRAREILAPAVDRDPEPVLLDALAAVEKTLGRIDEAEALWRRSALGDPGRPNPWFQLGRLALGRRQFADASDALEKADRLEPNRYEIVYNLARAYHGLGRKEDAKLLAARAEGLRGAEPEPSGGMGASP